MSFDTTTDPPGEQPTRVRYLVVAVTVLMAVLLYLDRFCVSFAERYIKEDLRLTDTQMAWFISVFFWSYALAQVPSGWLGDRFGVRGVLTAYILLWSLFTGLIGLAWGFVILIIMRLGCGLAQAGAYPSSAALLKRWIPMSHRAFASGLVGLGGRLGGAIAPILTAYLMVLFVPLDKPATFDAAQILNAPQLAGKLSIAGGQFVVEGGAVDGRPAAVVERLRANPAIGRIWNALPADARDSIAAQGASYAESLHLSRVPAAELVSPNAAPAPLSPATPPAELLASSLNDVLQQRELYDNDAFGRLNLSREALGFIGRQKNGDSLSDSEVNRLNRLILEAVFPDDIRKLYGSGWRPVLIAYGSVGLVVGAAFWFLFRNRPAEHPWCNPAERALVAPTDGATAAPQAASPLPLAAILKNRSCWLSSLSQFGTNVAWLFFVTWLPRYLMEIHSVPILERSVMTSIPSLAGIVGMFMGGKLTDWLTRRLGLRWGRALPMGLTRFAAAAAYLSCLWIDSPWMATLAFALGSFCCDLGVSAVWAFVQDVGGRHVGSILGWGNMWGNLGAAVAPPLYDLVLGASPQVADWNNMFMLCAAMFVVAGVSALGIDATVPVVAEQDSRVG